MHLYGSAKMMDEHSRISIQPHSMKMLKKLEVVTHEGMELYLWGKRNLSLIC